MTGRNVENIIFALGSLLKEATNRKEVLKVPYRQGDSKHRNSRGLVPPLPAHLAAKLKKQGTVAENNWYGLYARKHFIDPDGEMEKQASSKMFLSLANALTGAAKKPGFTGGLTRTLLGEPGGNLMRTLDRTKGLGPMIEKGFKLPWAQQGFLSRGEILKRLALTPAGIATGVGFGAHQLGKGSGVDAALEAYENEPWYKKMFLLPFLGAEGMRERMG